MDMRELRHFLHHRQIPCRPSGTLMVRFMPTASHTLENVEYTVKSMTEMKKKLDEGAYDNQTLLK